MEFALALVSLLNAAAPGVASIVMMIRRKDGTVAVLPLLEEADAKFAQNLAEAAEWLKTHPAK